MLRSTLPTAAREAAITSALTSPRRGRRAAIAAATLGLVLATPLAASAHVGVSPATAPAGEATSLRFSFGHGCDGEPTTELRFAIPAGVEAVHPHANSGWTITQTATEVVYTAVTPLPDGVRDTIELQVTLAPDLAVGTQIPFTVHQACTVGSYDWAEVAEAGQNAHDLAEPAPMLTVSAASGVEGHDGHGDQHGAGAADHEAAEAAAGDASTASLWLAGAGLAAGVAALAVSLTALRRSRK